MNILFVCTGNIFRSITAELALKKALGNDPRFQIFSAGTTAENQEMFSSVAEQLQFHGLDPKDHEQKKLSEEMIETADAVIAMNSDHQLFIKKNFDSDSFLFGDLLGDPFLNYDDIRDAVPDWETNEKTLTEYSKNVVDGIVDAIPRLASRLKDQPFSETKNASNFVLQEYDNKWSYLQHTEEMELKLIQWYLIVVGGLLAFIFKDIDDIVAVLRDPLTRIPLIFVVIYSCFLCFFLLVQKKHYARHLKRIEHLEKLYGHLERKIKEFRVVTSFRTRYALVILIGAGCWFLLTLAMGFKMLYATIVAVAFVAIFIWISFWKEYRH